MPLVDTTKPEVQKTLAEITAGLKPKEKAFVFQYIQLGGNASAAYRALKPDISEERSWEMGCVYARKPQVKAAITATLDILTSENAIKGVMHDLMHKSEDNIKLKAATELGKIGGLYAKHEASQAPAVLVQVNTPERMSTVHLDNVRDAETVQTDT